MSRSRLEEFAPPGHNPDALPLLPNCAALKQFAAPQTGGISTTPTPTRFLFGPAGGFDCTVLLDSSESE
jgi:hypothetical protein